MREAYQVLILTTQNQMIFSGLYRISNKTSKRKSISNQLHIKASGEAGDEDVLIPYEPLASQQFIQEYNRMIAVEEELKKKLQQSEAQLRTMPQNMSSFHSTQGTIYTAL